MSRLLFVFLILTMTLAPAALAQRPGLPLFNVGGDELEAKFAQLDFAQIMLENQNRHAKDFAEQNAKLIASGTVSALDLQASGTALHEFNLAAGLMRDQKAKEAIAHLQKAIRSYPKFVSAHQNLGVAYEDLDDNANARAEFEAAIRLDPKYAAPLLHLGRLDLSSENVAAAREDFEKAAALRPKDPQTLMLLCYAQNRLGDHSHAIETADRVHALEHTGYANVHYVAASSAVALRDYLTAEREFKAFIDEDPSNPLAPATRKNLEIIARNRSAIATSNAHVYGGGPVPAESLANTSRLHSELAALGEQTADDECSECSTEIDTAAAPSDSADVTSGFTMRKSVDEVAVFFSASRGGRSVTDLKASDVKILDANSPPERVIQFTPQSQLPLHLALLIDTSGSVQERFSFEKNAAARFVEKMLQNPADLGFVAGFSLETNVTQDFTSDHGLLKAGIQKLENKGGTSLFDAVSLACRKLAAFPERERVANVLVILTDGQDNSSHASLKQAIRTAESTGVTIYTISTTSHEGSKTDADNILLELAERSGGSAMFPSTLLSLNRTFDRLEETIRSRYLVAYKPANFVPNGAFRAIAITAQQNGQRLQIHARKGYHARVAAKPAQ